MQPPPQIDLKLSLDANTNFYSPQLQLNPLSDGCPQEVSETEQQVILKDVAMEF